MDPGFYEDLAGRLYGPGRPPGQSLIGQTRPDSAKGSAPSVAGWQARQAARPANDRMPGRGRYA
jgi:hypothetical protein